MDKVVSNDSNSEMVANQADGAAQFSLPNYLDLVEFGSDSLESPALASDFLLENGTPEGVTLPETKDFLHSRKSRLSALRCESERLIDELKVLDDLDGTLHTATDLSSTLDYIAQRVAEMADASIVLLWMVDERDSRLVVRSASCASPEIKKTLVGRRENLPVSPNQFSAEWQELNLDRLTDPNLLPPSLGPQLTDLAIKSTLVVPLLLQERVIGVVNILSNRDEQFSRKEIRKYLLLAHQAAIAISNAQAHSELRVQLAEMTRLQHVSTQINSNLALSTVLLSLVKAVAEAGGTDKSWLTLLDENRGELYHVAACGLSDEFLKSFSTIPLGQAPCGVAARDNRVVIVSEIDRDNAGGYFLEAKTHPGFKSVFSVPLAIKDGEVLGTFATFHSHPFRPSDHQTKVAGLYAQQAAIAIENARLYQSLERQLRHMRILESASEKINRELELNSVLRTVAESSRQVLGADRWAIYLLDQDSRETDCAVQEGLREESVQQIGQSFFSRDNESAVCCLGPAGFSDSSNTPGFPRLQEIASREGFKSLLFLPLVYREVPLGGLVLLYHQQRHFSDQETQVGQIFANQVAIAIDNARHYEAEKARVVKLEQLDQLKSDFVSNVSHELRTPLTTIKGSLQTILRGWDKLDERRRRSYVAMCHDASRRLYRLVEDLLFVSGIEGGRLEVQTVPIQVRSTLHQAVRQIQSQYQGRTIHTDIPESLPPVLADDGRVQEVLANLLDNSMKYCDGNAPVLVSCTVAESELVISVTDHGQGIASHDLPRLFTKFGRVDRTIRARAGTGLGLFICKQVVEQMGGRIWANSQPGVGSTFTFTLCLAPEGTPLMEQPFVSLSSPVSPVEH